MYRARYLMLKALYVGVGSMRGNYGTITHSTLLLGIILDSEKSSKFFFENIHIWDGCEQFHLSIYLSIYLYFTVHDQVYGIAYTVVSMLVNRK